MRLHGYDDLNMKLRLLSLTLLTAGLGSASAQNQVPGGTPLLVQPPQTQVQPAVTFVLGFPLLAMPETSAMPSRVKLTLSRPADALEITGQPQGMFASVTQDTVTVETKGVPVGQYPLRITGRWGNETRTVELLVSVYALNGTVAPITGPAEPGPTVPTTQINQTPVNQTPSSQTQVVQTPTVTPVQITAPTATVTTEPPAPVPEIKPIQTTQGVTSTPTLPAVVISTPAPVAPTPTTTTAPARQQDIPQATPTPTIPTNASIPYQTTPSNTASTERQFTVWGGMGTERGIVGGLNVGVSSRVAQFNAFQVAVRGTAELYPNSGSGLGLPVIGADVLLSRAGSRLYYGPSTSLAFGSGNSWAVGGLLGYSSTWNNALGYYVEGRARYAHLGGQNTIAPGFRVGFTYQLNR